MALEEMAKMVYLNIVNPKVLSKSIGTAYIAAAAHGKIEIVSLLLDRISFEDRNEAYAAAIVNNQVESIEILETEPGLQIDFIYLQELLKIVIEQGVFSDVERIIDVRTSQCIDFDLSESFIKAVTCNQLEIVKLFLSKILISEDTRSQEIQQARKMRSLDMIEILSPNRGWYEWVRDSINACHTIV